ncbi:hypothetical protein ROZALSC1DRAFT_30681 [Rozella allomycis CSF55]|uniref:Uncharacterized protein n=1 Tax=Rozella allomycis (strain CSF55) TaxID=988480 RepID=A0A4P9YF19_ROZAC|nr:hypothetical protein ROZALSC1DRAFT_30681 [Rozella allomycis CSF55]
MVISSTIKLPLRDADIVSEHVAGLINMIEQDLVPVVDENITKNLQEWRLAAAKLRSEKDTVKQTQIFAETIKSLKEHLSPVLEKLEYISNQRQETNKVMERFERDMHAKYIDDAKKASAPKTRFDFESLFLQPTLDENDERRVSKLLSYTETDVEDNENHFLSEIHKEDDENLFVSERHKKNTLFLRDLNERTFILYEITDEASVIFAELCKTVIEFDNNQQRVAFLDRVHQLTADVQKFAYFASQPQLMPGRDDLYLREKLEDPLVMEEWRLKVKKIERFVKRLDDESSIIDFNSFTAYKENMRIIIRELYEDFEFDKVSINKLKLNLRVFRKINFRTKSCKIADHLKDIASTTFNMKWNSRLKDRYLEMRYNESKFGKLKRKLLRGTQKEEESLDDIKRYIKEYADLIITVFNKAGNQHGKPVGDEIEVNFLQRHLDQLKSAERITKIFKDLLFPQ